MSLNLIFFVPLPVEDLTVVSLFLTKLVLFLKNSLAVTVSHQLEV